jgi:Sister chromatid cohesion protein Dcc1
LHVATGTQELSYAGAEGDLFLSEAIHEIMELVPTVPKLDRLKGALRGSEYGEEEWDNETRDEPMDQVLLYIFNLMIFN